MEPARLAMRQSALDPAGIASDEIATLFYWMSGSAIVIWVIVVGVAVYAICQPREHHPRTVKLLVIGGGAVFPTIILTGLLCASLPMLPELQRPAPEGSLKINVSGVMWWWRVGYERESGEIVTSANEIRLPLGRPVEFKLQSEDVIHSFWIPALGGKVDMIPGRETRLKLHPTRAGIFRGVCAEFCGAAHAQMNFDVVVMPAEEFDDWLAQHAAPHRSTGQETFLRSGCGACHQIRGTLADGQVGPDLTHFGDRLSIGAGVLPNTEQNLVRWIRQTHIVKPGVEMPAFRSLSQADAEQIASYLTGAVHDE
jgi:cytochrome c oxidase subunit 2